MRSNPPPRPPSVTIFCVLLACFSSLALLYGMYQMNSAMYERKGVDLLLTVFTGPAIALSTTLFMLRGWNWSRLLFAAVYTPFAIWIATTYPSTSANLRLVICAIGLALLFLPNAHWYFTRRDYHRRLALKESRKRRPRSAEDSTSRSTDYHY